MSDAVDEVTRLTEPRLSAGQRIGPGFCDNMLLTRYAAHIAGAATAAGQAERASAFTNALIRPVEATAPTEAADGTAE